MSRGLRALLAVLPLLAQGASAADAPLPPAAVPADAPLSTPVWQLRAFMRETYRGRASVGPDESTNDVRLDLALDAVDPTGRWLASLAAGAFWNLSRQGADGGPFGLGTVYDGRNPFLDVYHLHAEYQGPGLLQVARAGRQQAVHGKPATFDGAYALLRPRASPVSFFGFGGRTHHFFEVPAAELNLFEDWIASAGANWRVGPALRVEADYRFVKEEVQQDGGSRAPLIDHSYGVTATWRAMDTLRTRLTARGVDTQLAEASLSTSWFHPGWRLGLEARGFVQPAALRELNELDDPLFLTLGQSLPHARWKLEATQAFEVAGGNLGAGVGWTGRRLLWDSESPFNRNVGRVFLAVNASDIGLRGLFANVSLERLSSQALPLAGEGQLALNGAAGFEQKAWRVEAGTAYHRYQYLYFRDVEELADVRSVYAEVRVRPLGWLQVRARYSAELFDRVLHTVTASVTQSL